MSKISPVIEFEEKYPHEKGFADHFRTQILPVLGQMEADRLKSLRLYKAAIILSYTVIILFVIFYEDSTTIKDRLSYVPGLLLIGFIPSGLIEYYFNKRNKNFLMPRIMSFLKGVHYQAERCIPSSDIHDYLIVPSYTEYKGSDYIQYPGRYTSSKLTLNIESGSGRNRRSRTAFSGIAVLIDLPRPIGSPVALKIDKGSVLNWLDSLGTGYERIALVDPVFEKIFEVYGKDQVEARSILSPDVMELFLRLNFLFSNWKSDLDELDKMTRNVISNHNIEEVRDHSGSKFMANFMNDKLLLLLSTPQDLFEPVSLKKPCTDIAPIRAVLYQAHLIDELCTVLRKAASRFP
jgi:hypothetical protein